MRTLKSMSHKRLLRLLPLFIATSLGASLLSVPAQAATPSTPFWVKDATIYEVNVRQYTQAGTLNAFADSLPRLQKLGVKILWFMPIQPISVLNRKGTLGSEYSIADYTAVNPELGTSSDFQALVTKAHQMGFKVLMDWVGDHSGWDNKWITNKDWYHQDADGNIIPPNPDWTDVAWLNYENQDLRAAMLAAMKYWVTNFDIDGFRADYATGVPADFWATAITELQKNKPLFMLAECQGQRSLLESGFSADYDWNLLNIINGIAKGSNQPADIQKLAASEVQDYPTGTFPMAFFTNHDENTYTGSEYTRLGKSVPAFAAMYFTYPGIPLVYSGQEVGNTKQIAFFEKDLIPGLTSPNTTSAFYAKLISLKKKNSVLWNGFGAPLTAVTSDNSQVIAFARKSSSDAVVTIANLTSSLQRVTLRLGALAGSYRKFTTNGKGALPKVTTLLLKPYQFEVYSTNAA